MCNELGALKPQRCLLSAGSQVLPGHVCQDWRGGEDQDQPSQLQLWGKAVSPPPKGHLKTAPFLLNRWGPLEPVRGPPSGCEVDAPPALSVSDSSGGVRSFLQHKMGACRPTGWGGPSVGTRPTAEADLVSSFLSKACPVGARLPRALLGDLDVRMPGTKCLDFYPLQAAGAVMSSASLHAVGASPGIGNLSLGSAGHRLSLACGCSTCVSASPSVCLSLWDTSHWIRDPQSNTTSLFH